MSTGTEFLDYDSYKSKITSIWDEIWDKLDIGDDIDDIEDIDLDFESDEDFDEDFDEDITVEDEDNIEVEKSRRKCGIFQSVWIKKKCLKLSKRKQMSGMCIVL